MTVNLLDVKACSQGLCGGATKVTKGLKNGLRNIPRLAGQRAPLTQAGCVRILSNPAFSRNAVTPQQALKLLSVNLNHPSHLFWPDDVSFAEAVEPIQKQMVGHQQVSDAYLLGLAMHRKARLATMDRSVSALLPREKQAAVVVL